MAPRKPAEPKKPRVFRPTTTRRPDGRYQPADRAIGEPLPKLETAKLIEEQGDAIQAHVQHLVQLMVEGAKQAKTPPGIAVMAGCEFITLMLHFNIPEEGRALELSRFQTYITNRLKELTDVTAH